MKGKHNQKLQHIILLEILNKNYNVNNITKTCNKGDGKELCILISIKRIFLLR